MALLLGELPILKQELFERGKFTYLIIGVLILVSWRSVKILVTKTMEVVVEITIKLFELLPITSP